MLRQAWFEPAIPAVDVGEDFQIDPAPVGTGCRVDIQHVQLREEIVNRRQVGRARHRTGVHNRDRIHAQHHRAVDLIPTRRRTLHGVDLPTDPAMPSDWLRNQPVRMRSAEGQLIAVGVFDDQRRILHPAVVVANDKS